jgi:hypothetical protein
MLPAKVLRTRCALLHSPSLISGCHACLAQELEAGELLHLTARGGAGAEVLCCAQRTRTLEACGPTSHICTSVETCPSTGRFPALVPSLSAMHTAGPLT